MVASGFRFSGASRKSRQRAELNQRLSYSSNGKLWKDQPGSLVPHGYTWKTRRLPYVAQNPHAACGHERELVVVGQFQSVL